MFNSQNFSGVYEPPPIRPKMASSVSSVNSDEDNDTAHVLLRRDRRRELHTQAEQRRRDAIKSGYEALLPLCHPTSPDNGSSKLSKATILQRAISQIKSLNEYTAQKEKESENLKNELFALRIMNSNYEEIAQGNKNQMKTEEVSEVPEQVKFEIFGQFMENLFLSFDKSTNFDNFTAASSTIIHWVEKYCKPQNLNGLVETVLTDVLSEYHGSQPGMMSANSGTIKMEQDSSFLQSNDQPLMRSFRSLQKSDLMQYTPSDLFYDISDSCDNTQDEYKRFPTNARRQTTPSIVTIPSQSQPCVNSILDVQLDDELMSMSPNAIDFSFLDSLDQENLIDDMWMPCEKSEF